jgi:hypothetical protein
MSKTLQDVKAGDVVVMPNPCGLAGWIVLTVSSTTNSRIRAGKGEWERSGARRGILDRGEIYTDDHPEYRQWIQSNAGLAARLVPALSALPESTLRNLAAKLGVKP